MEKGVHTNRGTPNRNRLPGGLKVLRNHHFRSIRLNPNLAVYSGLERTSGDYVVRYIGVRKIDYQLKKPERLGLGTWPSGPQRVYPTTLGTEGGGCQEEGGGSGPPAPPCFSWVDSGKQTSFGEQSNPDRR